MKFAVIGDIHTGKEVEIKGQFRKMSRYSEELVNLFVNKMNEEVHPEFVMQMGDAIEDESRDIDINNYNKTLSLLSNLKCPVYNVVGNHEQRNLSEEDIKKILGYQQLYYSFDKNNLHIIVLFTDDFKRETITISQEQITWLKQDLKKTNYPALVFVHHSFADQDLNGNWWFEGKPTRCLVQDRELIRKEIEETGKVKFVINGHLHWNNLTIHRSIPYITLPSLVENFTGNDIPSKGWTIVDVSDKSINIEVKGNQGINYTFESF